MDKQYLKEHNLLEAHKQFMRLCEWTSISSLVEDDDDNQENPVDTRQDMGSEPNMGGNDQNDNIGGEDPSMMGGEDPNGGMGGEDPSMMGGEDPSMMGGEDPSMMGGEDHMLDNMGESEDDSVIDVDDITNAQEKMNSKINTIGRDVEGFDDKIKSLMSALNSMEKLINNNNAQIQSFKQEFEKRNPTQTEKLNLRSLDSYPFNVNPKDYWKAKGIDSNYDAYSDNSEPTTQEYQITNSDVDDFDERKIENSFNIDDDLIQDIAKIFEL